MNHAIGNPRSDHWVAASDAAQHTVEQMTAASRSPLPVFIHGAAGTGKKHAARVVHSLGTRASGPLEVFSARGISEERQHSELFGGNQSAPGALTRAEGGTLVVDDLEALAAPVLAELIDWLKKTTDRTAVAAGENPRLAITSRNAEFPADVEFVRIELAPLAERNECVLPLSAHFLGIFSREAGTDPVGITSDARCWLLEETWPGNVRELRERVRQAVHLAGSGAISAEALVLAAEGDEVLSFKEAKRAFETRYVEGLLRRCRGNISRAARLARKDRKDFYDVIRRTGVDPAQFRA